MNREVALHNIRILCSTIAMYVIPIAYRRESGFLLLEEQKSHREKEQQKEIHFVWHGTRSTLSRSLHFLRISTRCQSSLVSRRCCSTAGATTNLWIRYKRLIAEGQKYSYSVNGAKCWLIVKYEGKTREADGKGSRGRVWYKCWYNSWGKTACRRGDRLKKLQKWILWKKGYQWDGRSGNWLVLRERNSKQHM